MIVTMNGEVRQILRAGSKCGKVFKLPAVRLERAMYEAVNKILDAGGGKWDRKQGGHVFPSEQRLDDLLAQLDSGGVVHVKKATQAFYTPDWLADELVQFAGVRFGDRVLEPSAGEGAIAKALANVGAKVTCVESDNNSCEVLRFAGFVTLGADFLKCSIGKDFDGKFDAVVMNPPFTKNQDIEHVRHAAMMVKSGGVVASIMSPGWLFGTVKKHVAFREWVNMVGLFRRIPAGAFAGEGTNISTVMVKLRIN